jgi:RNA polymerase sigma-70 factor (ECF subfamily)
VGYEPGFEEFFQDHHARLFRALCMITGDRDEADEVAQVAFVKVWERWIRVSRMQNPTGYLYRVALNAARSRYRSTLRALKRIPRDPPPNDALSLVEDRHVVMRALGQLTKDQRAAVVLTNLLGLSSEEAGEILGMKAATVRALSSRARASMKLTVGDPT